MLIKTPNDLFISHQYFWALLCYYFKILPQNVPSKSVIESKFLDDVDLQ